MKKSFYRYQKAINLTFLIIFAIGMVVYFGLMPPLCDDYGYRSMVLPLGEAGPPWAPHRTALTDTVFGTHVLEINSRMANLVQIPMLRLPEWAMFPAVALAWIAIMWGTLRIARVRTRHIVAGAAAMAMWVWFPSWHDGMGTSVFQYNYIISTALGLLLVAALLSRCHFPDEVMPYGVFGLLTGMWHEGFSAPIAGSLLLFMLLKKSWRKPRNVAAAVGLVIGLMWIMGSPALYAKTSGLHDLGEIWLYRILIVTEEHPGIVVAMLFWFVGIVAKGWSDVRHNTALNFMMLNALLSAATGVVTGAVARGAIWGDFCSVAAILILIREMYPRLERRVALCRSVAVVLIAIAMIPLAGADCYAYRFRMAFEKAADRYTSGESGTLFADIPVGGDTFFGIYPFMDSGGAWSYMTLYSVADYLRPGWRGKAPAFVMVPQALSEFTAGDGERVGDSGVVHYRGCLVDTSSAIDSVSYAQAVVKRKDNIISETPIVGIPFLSGKDGERYVWLSIYSPERLTRPENEIYDIRIKRYDAIRRD